MKKKLLSFLSLMVIAIFAFAATKGLQKADAAPEDDTRIVYDFAAAAAAGENPANKNGSAANGQKFYGWESADKTYSGRQDYKGYEWAEGSVLPEVCHVWRRSDRINGNMTAADAEVKGLKCPSQKEMAIDGLTAGKKVVIEYEGEGQILYATGVDYADPTATPNTVAIVGDGTKAAISGTTTIASGTPIHIVSTDGGYFVFRVLKDMVITKITISDETPIEPETVAKPCNITVATGIENGTVQVSQVQACEGDEITVTVTPNEDFELDEITVVGAISGTEITVTDGKFIMPAEAVTVSATFTQTTGVQAVKAVGQKNTAIYTIGGQRVNSAKNGLFIINGRKVVK